MTDDKPRLTLFGSFQEFRMLFLSLYLLGFRGPGRVKRAWPELVLWQGQEGPLMTVATDEPVRVRECVLEAGRRQGLAERLTARCCCVT